MHNSIACTETGQQTDDKYFRIIDNGVDTGLADRIWEILQRPDWRWGQRSTGKTPQKFWAKDLDDEEAIIELFEGVKHRLPTIADNDLVIRKVYANGHTHGLGGSIHQDNESPGFYTLLYYANPEWHPRFGGETQYYSDDLSQVIHTVLPSPLRLVFFDARIPHFGSPPSREFWDLRITVAFKLQAVPKT
ncbi:hypothetical protein FKG94_06270 [Exilibacterium tricleocarpae]|uniref:Uncharacterized protein n=1 Tax=Exilibacterium tricleocarpae TaxID=2591008 RepID=A0A545U471_9GAMM|nr:hypothetical protein [Exilibacterium tricleocarpae]TQV84258.1 hypothetical protein FKG94_06270 [Exilibacterium tricleocarpae]